MLKISKNTINYATSYVIRDGLRWGRYKLDFNKDVKRIITLLITSGINGLIENNQKTIVPNEVSGWSSNFDTEKVVKNNVDFLEIIALVNHWNMWEYYEGFFEKE